MAADFSNLKVDDEIIVDITSTGEWGRHLVGGKVTSRTRTRLTVRWGGENGYHKTFTNDGHQYPRPDHRFRDRGAELLEVNEENIKALKHSRAVRAIKGQGWNLDRLLTNTKNLSCLSLDDLEKVKGAIEVITNLVKEQK